MSRKIVFYEKNCFFEPLIPGACGARRRRGACGAGGGAPAAPEEGRLRRQRRGAKVAYGAQGELEKGACPPPPDHYKPLAEEGYPG